MLGSIRAGERVTVEELMAETGIGFVSAEGVLRALTSAQLFQQHGREYIRMAGISSRV
jgi:DNA-binding GntR family transcriptional regulator